MSKDPSAKYYQNNIESLRKKLEKDIKVFLKKEKLEKDIKVFLKKKKKTMSIWS